MLQQQQQPQQSEWEVSSSGNWTHGGYAMEERRGSRERFLKDHVHFGLAAAAGLSYQSQPAHALFGEQVLGERPSQLLCSS